MKSAEISDRSARVSGSHREDLETPGNLGRATRPAPSRGAWLRRPDDPESGLSAVAVALALAAALGLVAAVVFLDWQSADAGREAGAYPAILSEFELETLDGGKLAAADLRGKVVVIDFWATWCTPCHVQSKIIAGLHEEYEASDVAFLAINSGEDRATAAEFAEEEPFPYPLLLDPEARVMETAGLYALPTLVILDRKGGVTFLASGITGRSSLQAAIEEARATTA